MNDALLHLLSSEAALYYIILCELQMMINRLHADKHIDITSYVSNWFGDPIQDLPRTPLLKVSSWMTMCSLGFNKELAI